MTSKWVNLYYIGCSNRDAEEHEEKNSIWLKEADLSTLSVDKEVTKQEQELLYFVKQKRFKIPGIKKSRGGAEKEAGQKGESGLLLIL